MWAMTFEERLREWRELRATCETSDLESALHHINDWWWQAPMVNHYLHWHDQTSWPGPWDLLADNIFCDLARALGIMYTVMMLERADITDICITAHGDDNLVQVNGGKYILNWCPRQLLNIQSLETTPRHTLTSSSLNHLLG